MGMAQPSHPEIDAAKRHLSDAAEALQAAGSGQARLAALGGAVTAHESALAAYRTALRTMASRESHLAVALQRDRARLDGLVAALQSLGRAPRSALLAYPGGPVGAARAASLMAEVSPALQERIEAFNARIAALRQLRISQDVARVEIRGALASLQDLRTQTRRGAAPQPPAGRCHKCRDARASHGRRCQGGQYR